MVDELDSLTDQDAASDSGEPAASPAQSVGQASGGVDWEARFKGYQSSTDRELAELRSALEEQRLASLPEEERDTFRQQKTAKEIEKLRQENELLKLQRDVPAEAFEAYTTLLAGKTAAEQIAYLATKINTAQPAAVVPPAVNKNNPQRTPPPGVILGDGTQMNADIADRILSSLSRVPRG